MKIKQGLITVVNFIGIGWSLHTLMYSLDKMRTKRGGVFLLSEYVINDNSQIVERYKPDVSIALLREFEPMAIALHSDGYYLTYSGGKDSDTDLEIAQEAGVKFSVHYNITTVDAAQCLIHIKQTRERLSKKGIQLYLEPPGKFKDGTQKTMWSLIERKGMPPTRICRYCCDHLKERGGKGRLVITGVRWSESTVRKSRKPLEIVTSQRKDKKLFNDNDKDRRLFENCMQKGKRVVNPIINWLDEDVWQYITERKVPYCSLYDLGEKRIGCIGCPMGGTKGQEEDFERYPHYKKLYIQAFDKMLIRMNFRGRKHGWKTGNDVFDWWLYSTDSEQKKILEGQISMYYNEDEELWEIE